MGGGVGKFRVQTNRQDNLSQESSRRKLRAPRDINNNLNAYEQAPSRFNEKLKSFIREGTRSVQHMRPTRDNSNDYKSYASVRKMVDTATGTTPQQYTSLDPYIKKDITVINNFFGNPDQQFKDEAPIVSDDQGQPNGDEDSEKTVDVENVSEDDEVDPLLEKIDKKRYSTQAITPA